MFKKKNLQHATPPPPKNVHKLIDKSQLVEVVVYVIYTSYMLKLLILRQNQNRVPLTS